ncbi:MAG: 50S ribosomal protein L25 [Flavobacteriales bacterium]|jgi:large subunit ribosomal protein L25|nr:50S ribosomal protein L25 [Flavobacteriales bacterium]|tara:strand:+ start:655 stop:1290 length:636 start_codon:yes stop_codon:yes gene_type:complete
MKTFALSADVRETNKIANRALRNQGKVPCVLYGGEKQVYFSATENDLNKLVNTPDVYLLNIDIDGESYQAILQDIQFHPLTDRIVHIDFLQVFDDKEVTVSIPVNFIGTPIGVRNGGNLLVRRRAIKTRAIPANLPDAIEINIEDLKIGKFLYIGDVRDEKYTFLAEDKSVIVGVKTARGAIEDEEEDVEGEEGETAEGGDTPAAEAPAAE